VMRSGEVIWSQSVAEMSVRSLATLIAGAEVEALEEKPRRHAPVAAEGSRPLLELRNLTGRYLRGIDLTIEPGEIVGVAGLIGSGMEELPYIVAGASADGFGGEILIDGVAVDELDIEAARAHGIVLIPADRSSEGIFAEFNVRENVSLAALPTLRSANTVIPARERRFATDWLEQVRADTQVVERPILTLSGGNQQKTLLARWLSVAPRLLAVSEPTAGIDIGSRAGIYEELRTRADEGLTVLMSSSDTEDLVAACDRVIALRDGEIAADLRLDKVSKSTILGAMEGVDGAHDA
jgi:ribose transport system ATP-binding protein